MTEVLPQVNGLDPVSSITTSSVTETIVTKTVIEKSVEEAATTEMTQTIANGTTVTTVEEKVATATVAEAVVQGQVKAAEEVAKQVEVAAAVIDTTPAQPIHTSGPDELVAADSLISWRGDTPVKLRMEDTGPLSEKPISVSSMFQNTVKRVGDKVALGSKRDGVWVTWTYNQYYEDVKKAAKGFIKLGLEAHHGVGIIGFNSPEWFISDLGAIFAGGFAVGIYTTNSAEACHYVADNCQANIIVVENDQQLQKILKVRDRLPHLKAIVQYKDEPKVKEDNIYSWKDLMKLGESGSDDEVRTRLRAQAPNKCCTLIYTSGTTGNPKGVMLSHDNITWTAIMTGRQAKLEFGTEVLVSYLPLSHVAAQLLDIYMPLCYGGSTWFAEPDALKGSLAKTLNEVKPTAFLGVPRVWEKMQEKLTAIGKSKPPLIRKVAAWAKDIGLRGNLSKMNGFGKKKRGTTPFGWAVANRLVFRKARFGLGLERCKFCLTGAAPIMRETLDFFMSLDLPLMELYGMSESTGPHTVSFPDRFCVSSVGKEFFGATTMLANSDADGNGEICMSGRHVFMGYLNMEEKTKETVDDQGWLHSGDVGRKDDKGFLYITGRIKELLITAGGENVAPVPLEDNVKEELPIISNCMMIGDKKKFLSILLTLKVEIDPDTLEPTDDLTSVAKEWCRAQGSNANKLSEILDNQDRPVLDAIQKGIDRANKRAPSRAQNIQKWTILPRDFSVPGGELGPTLKLKRPVVNTMYTSTINAFYGE